MGIQVFRYLAIAGLGWISGFMYGLNYGEHIAPTDCAGCGDGGGGGGAW